jgi:hypothetical protein
MVPIQCDHGSICHSKVRKMGCQDTKHIGILSNQRQRMLMERAFGMLEGKFQILLKIIDIPLHHMPNLVMVCICLHNMCIVNSNGFDMD